MASQRASKDTWHMQSSCTRIIWSHVSRSGSEEAIHQNKTRYFHTCQSGEAPTYHHKTNNRASETELFLQSWLRDKAYVVTQAVRTKPMNAEFWRMVWELGSNCIVMLTKVFDFMRVSCVFFIILNTDLRLFRSCVYSIGPSPSFSFEKLKWRPQKWRHTLTLW